MCSCITLPPDTDRFPFSGFDELHQKPSCVSPTILVVVPPQKLHEPSTLQDSAKPGVHTASLQNKYAEK